VIKYNLSALQVIDEATNKSDLSSDEVWDSAERNNFPNCEMAAKRVERLSMSNVNKRMCF